MTNYVPQTGAEVAVSMVSVPVPADADAALSDRVLARIEASVADNTRRAYRADWTDFAEWCAGQRRSALPATAQTLAEYVSARADLGRAPASISRAISAIRVAHRANGYQPPDTLAARAVLKTYRNERASGGLPNSQPAAPLSVDQLKKISAALAACGVMGQRDRLILVLGWAMMGRRSELIGLDIEDIAERDEGLDVMVRKAKNDQAAEGRKVAVPYGSDASTCPVRLTRAWLALLAARGITSGPLLRRMDKNGRIAGEAGFGKGISGRVSASQRLSAPAIGIILRRSALAAGIPVKDLSPHSLRAGGATGAYLGGADLLSIGRHGGWDDGSPVLAKYIRGVDSWKKNPMYGAGL
jgi:site-specific recombinase XerD